MPLYTGDDENLPHVSILMAVHNEEDIIVEKIKSIFYTSYPINRIELIIGSDASDDSTDRICKIYTENYQQMRFFDFGIRRGKPEVINTLAEHATGEISYTYRCEGNFCT